MSDSVIFCGYSRVRFGTKPAGSYILANIFRETGLSSIVIDHVFSMRQIDLFELIDKYVTLETRFICLSTTLLGSPGSMINVMSECDRLFDPIMNKIKSINPNCVFIVGGSKVTRNEKSILPYDYKVKGQGEITLKAIIAHELYGDDLILDEDGFVSDKIYDYQDFNKNKLLIFTNEDGVQNNETLPIELGRGCVFKCSFCDYNMTGKNFGDYNKTEDVLYETLMHNYDNFGTTRYQFSDDTLNDSEEKIDQLYKVSKRLPFELEFGGYIRVELLDKIKGSAEKLMDSGLRGANLGIETLNKKAGSTVGKGYGINAVDSLVAARNVWRDQVAVNINIIIGLPYDTIEDIQKQQDILVNGDFFDNVFYTPLGIPKIGESLFSKGLYQKYYRVATDIPESYRENAIKYEQTRTFFEENINWETDLMNVGDAITLSRELTEDFNKKRPYIINNVTAFCVMALLKDYTMKQLRTLKYVEEEKNLNLYSYKKVTEYVNYMKFQAGPVPFNYMKNRIIPTIPATRMPFKSKIEFSNNKYYPTLLITE